jgi:uncharacterized protein YjeT (DUF2065 family)
MDTSILIARLMGPVLVVIGLVALLDAEGFRALGREFMASRGLLYLAGLLTFVAGLAIVNTHNLWVAGWPVIVTLYGWLALVGGLVRLALPAATRSLGEAMLRQPASLRLAGATHLLLGAVLVLMGYR